MEWAPFAVHEHESKGRFYHEQRADFRSPYQRDRDRILHSTSFRRLMHKTQVFVVHEGDLFRTRLTHSLEVAQVARTLARRLRVNEDLAELISLAHDLGHPPFGHAGEDVLTEKMQNFGGFDHNAQAIRIVSHIEERYAGFLGLNLSWESLEGIAKHNGPIEKPYHWAYYPLIGEWDLNLSSYASLEAQIAAISDDIAYNHHDVLDGLRSGLIDEEQLQMVPIMQEIFFKLKCENPHLSQKIRIYEALSRFFGMMVNDVYEESLRILTKENFQSSQEIRNYGQAVIRFSPEFYEELKILRKFLFENLYRHDLVMQKRETAQAMIARAFDEAMENVELLPMDWRKNLDNHDEQARARLVCDYISGMTDRFISEKWQFAHQQKWQ